MEKRDKSKRRRLLAVIGVGLVGVLAFVLLYFEPQTAFIDDEVSETLPGLDVALAASTTTTTTLAVPVGTDATTVSTTAPTAVSTTDVAVPTETPPMTDSPSTTTVPVTTAPLALPANSIGAALASASATGAPVVLSTGTFISGEHDTSGTALVVALPDGSVVVRFEDLDTSNGPDLRVVLSTDDASDAWKYDGRHILGELKGNIGDQNYTIPPDVDLTQFGSVVVWCERFSVAFGAAPLDVVA